MGRNEQTAAAVGEHIAAFNDGDLERLLAGFTEDALWITGRHTARGQGELRELFGGAISGLLPRLALENLVVDGVRAACQLTETLVFEQEQRSYPIAAFFRFRDGLIASAKVYREGSADLD